MNEYSLKSAGYKFMIAIGALTSVFFVKDIIEGIKTGSFIHHSDKYGVTLHGDAALSFMVGFIIIGVLLVIFGILGLRNLYSA